MGVLADWQIRERVKIEPFSPQAIRPGVISYGVTSYGYDVRVARHFKVFTNARCTVVDPKQFDPLSFIDVEGDFCLIPPNSFALAETVEYIEVPRDVLGICVGKSTYARCFSAETRVALADGRSLSLETMARQWEDGERFAGYALSPTGRVIVAEIVAPRFTGRDFLIEIVLDNGEAIRCTPDHGFLKRDGRIVEAGSLRPGDSLMPLYRSAIRGCEAIYQPSSGQFEPTRRPALAGAGASIANMGASGRGNHRVVSVRDLPGLHDVYCLTVPECGNFALSAGVLVQNCGIILNVTPLEPEWRGKVTLEISNTTPLPAKVYAGEGIAQIVFLEASKVCEASYADKAGRYQDQKGLTLPFVHEEPAKGDSAG